MNRQQRRHGGGGCHKHRGPDGRKFALVWTCPDCFETWFSELAKDQKRELTEREIEIDARVALACLSCARAIGEQDGWEFIDFNIPDHNRYMVFCPHRDWDVGWDDEDDDV